MNRRGSKTKLFRPVLDGTAKSLWLPKIRVSPAEHELIWQKVGDSENSYAKFAISAMLGRPVRSNVAATIINDLRMLAQQQKELAAQLPEHSAAFQETLQEIVEAIKRVGQGRGRL